MLLGSNIAVMHLLLRTLLLLFTSSRRSRLSVWGTSSLPMRVLPTDIDIAMHVNNGMYFSLMDLGRFDLMVRAGIWQKMRRRRWSPVAAGETIAFRKSLQLWQQYTIESKIIGSIRRRSTLNNEWWPTARSTPARTSPHGLSPRAGREPGGNPGRVRRAPADLELPEWIHEWRENNALPGARKAAPHLWH
ncbi:protein THEM6 [Arthrobacter sp. Hiyo8]|nr:protein THEM6 [Arthrobacter sp. Hiyo8]